VYVGVDLLVVAEMNEVIPFVDKPICAEDQKTIYGVSENEIAHISCRVNAFPEVRIIIHASRGRGSC